MRILSALFDAVLLPLDVVHDGLDFMSAVNIGGKSRTRERIEDIEDSLTP